MTSRKSNGGIVDAALAYIKRGWNPVPVGFKEKKPTGKAWQKVIITEATVGQYFNGAPQNIGVQMGANSGGLADVDLDCAEAIAAAPYIIPPTGAVFGRATKRSSHRLYKSDFKPDRAVHPFKNCDGKMMVELRIGGGAKGAQSVFPPSTHKETGEAIDWDRTASRRPSTARRYCARSSGWRPYVCSRKRGQTRGVVISRR